MSMQQRNWTVTATFKCPETVFSPSQNGQDDQTALSVAVPDQLIAPLPFTICGLFQSKETFGQDSLGEF